MNYSSIAKHVTMVAVIATMAWLLAVAPQVALALAVVSAMGVGVAHCPPILRMIPPAVSVWIVRLRICEAGTMVLVSTFGILLAGLALLNPLILAAPWVAAYGLHMIAKQADQLVDVDVQQVVPPAPPTAEPQPAAGSDPFAADGLR